jgi:hypothetical protein
MISKKAYRNINILMSIIISISLPLTVLAEELDSTNFKIVGATTQGGGIVESTSGNYSTLLGVGSISSDPRIYSTSYKLGTSPETPFLPAVPTISCFETTTDGYSACSTGPTELSTGGMTALCGPGGCYDRARFEISNQANIYNTNNTKLVAYWPMDETVNDSCAGGQDACDVKGPNEGIATGTTIVDGIYSKARSFNGSSFINVGRDSSIDLTSQGAISVWVKSNREYPSDTTSTVFRGIMGKVTGGGGGQQSYFFDWYGTNTTRYFRANIGHSGGLQGFTISNFDMGDSWRHFVLTWNGTSITLYIDGSLYGTTAQNYNAQYLDIDTNIGKVFHNWDGLLDEVMIFNQGLTQQEVEDLYDATAPIVNPSDTLYAIMISTDNFVSDIRYIDASTFTPESYSTHNINDFMTKTDWEIETFNVQGLEAGKTYYLKAFALKGDFTQTETGPIKSATTATGTLFFDIDIANSTGYTTETSPPYSISFTGAYELIGGSAAITAGNRIWMDTETNSQGGFAIIGNGLNGGLYSSTTSQTITSATANLDQVNSGFGLQSEYIDYDTSSPLLGAISVTSDYSGSINSVGAISTTPKKIYDGNGPIVGGRMALKVIAKPGTSYTPASNYQESITLIFVPRY